MRTRQAPALLGQKILVTIDKWDITSRYPEGHFVRALGKVESKEAEQESLLLEFDVPYRPFGKAILDCLPTEGEQWVVPPKRDDPFGETARTFDNSIYVALILLVRVSSV
jgi:exosome complex exonuclease DIS3/RRP44